MKGLELKSKIDIINNKIVIDCYLKSDLKKPQVAGFLKNLKDEYLNLSTGHIKFDVKTKDGTIAKNALIENEEQAGGQYVKHEYTVTNFDEEKCELDMESPQSKVLGNFLCKSYETEVKTKVQFHFKEEDVFHSKLSLKFAGKVNLFLALMVGTKKIWQNHFREEIAKGAKIMLQQNSL